MAKATNKRRRGFKDEPIDIHELERMSNMRGMLTFLDRRPDMYFQPRQQSIPPRSAGNDVPAGERAQDDSRLERTKGEYDILLDVPDGDHDTVLTREQLAEFQRNLSLLSDAGVEREYERCWREAWYDGKRVPSAMAVQQLVAAWRVLRKFRMRNCDQD